VKQAFTLSADITLCPVLPAILSQLFPSHKNL